jgi:2-amino-4-hydroxy-6-hydroxymethyldihydropteridine diphosphokinase
VSVTAFVGLGANLGDPSAQLRAALAGLSALPETRVSAVSSFYRSAAIGPAGQPDYCNAAAALQTGLAPLVLLDALQALEAQAGRVRGERWGPRVLDLDLLSYGDLTFVHERLTLPHPELPRRDFVLVPLAEIAPNAALPGLGTVAALHVALGSTELPRWP